MGEIVRVSHPDSDIPSASFMVYEVHEDLVCGSALEGPLQYEYGEPSAELVDTQIRGFTDEQLLIVLENESIDFSASDAYIEAGRRWKLQQQGK